MIMDHCVLGVVLLSVLNIFKMLNPVKLVPFLCTIMYFSPVPVYSEAIWSLP